MEVINTNGEEMHVLSNEEKNWALFAHLSALAFFIPFGQILGPLIIWLIKKDEFPFVDDQGKESLNFQLSIFIYQLACIPLVFLIIGIPILVALGILDIVLVIIAAVAASSGKSYRYPLSLKLIR